MPNGTVREMPFAKLGRREIDVGFDGGDVSSDGGLLLLRQVERRLGLLKAVAQILPDPRSPLRVKHKTGQLLRQRVFGLCQGYEDLNDHDTLRNDLAVQTALERDTAGASSPTLCRFENRADRAAAVATSQILVEQFIASFKEAPRELILDFDATDDIVHGNQDGRHFQRLLRQRLFPAPLRLLRRAVAGGLPASGQEGCGAARRRRHPQAAGDAPASGLAGGTPSVPGRPGFLPSAADERVRAQRRRLRHRPGQERAAA